MLAALFFRALELWPFCLAALVLLGFGIVLFYPRQVRSLGRPWQWLLPALRAMALAAVALSILRPVVSRDKTAGEEGSVLVLLDRSLSMGVSDRLVPDKSPDRKRILGQLVTLADDLRLLPEGVRSKVIADVSESLKQLESQTEEIARARREIDYARLSGREPQAAQSRLEQAVVAFLAAAREAEQAARAMGSAPVVIEHLARLAQPPKAEHREEWIRGIPAAVQSAKLPAEASQDDIDEKLYQSNEQVRTICDKLARLSRLELSWLVLAEGQRSLLAQIAPQTPVTGFAIGDGLAPVSLGRERPTPNATPLEASAIVSDINAGLRVAMQRLNGQPLQAIVLFSDGRQVGGRDAIPPGLLSSGVPIFTVSTASPHVSDLSIEHVDLPRAVFVGETLTVRVLARSTSIEPTRMVGHARLAPDGAEAVTASLRSKDPQPDADQKCWLFESELRVRLDKPGLQRIVISVPPQDGEATLANNQVERWVKVTAQTLRVLAISGSPGWDFRYLRNALLRSPIVQLRDTLVVPSLSALAMTRHDILQQDIIILNDISRDSLSIEQWDAIRELVTQRGGSVILIPGVSHPQQDYTGHVMSDLLPYSIIAKPGWRIWPGEMPQYHVALASEDGMEAFRLADDPEMARRRWDELPGFYRYLAIPQLKPNARTVLQERESRDPLLTESRLGMGRVFFFGMSETWRWRYKVGSRDQDRFWLQLLRHAADEPYALASGPMLLDVDKVVAAPGEPIQVRARLNSRQSDLPLPPAVDLSILQHGQIVRSASLEPAGNASDGRYVTVIPQLRPGDYELRVVVPSGDYYSSDLSLPIRVAPDSEPELVNVAGDLSFLRRLAEITGGKSLTMEQIGTLPQLLDEARLRQPRIRELRLWDSHYLFLFVLSCLAGEWALRKRFGLA